VVALGVDSWRRAGDDVGWATVVSANRGVKIIITASRYSKNMLAVRWLLFLVFATLLLPFLEVVIANSLKAAGPDTISNLHAGISDCVERLKFLDVYLTYSIANSTFVILLFGWPYSLICLTVLNFCVLGSRRLADLFSIFVSVTLAVPVTVLLMRPVSMTLHSFYSPLWFDLQHMIHAIISTLILLGSRHWLRRGKGEPSD